MDGKECMEGLEVKRFTKFMVHHGSVVMIRFTILFLRVWIRLGSLKCKQKLSISCQLDWVITVCTVHLDQFRIVVLLHDYFRQVFNDCYQQNMYVHVVP